MALTKTIRCSECGYEISREESACPHCGTSMNKIRRKNALEKIKPILLLLVFTVPVILGLISAFTEFQLGLWFILGVFIQGYFLIQNNFNKEIGQKFLWCIVISAVITAYLISEAHDSSAPIFSILIPFCFIFAILFHFIFRKQIVYKINEQALLVWNIIFLYLYYLRFGFYNIPVIIFIILVFVNLAIIFSKRIPNFWGRVFLYGWFLFIMIFLSIYQFDLKIFTNFLSGASHPAAYNPLDAILTGMIFLYVVSYSIFILVLFFLLIPLPTKKGEKFNFQKRKEEIKNQSLILSESFDAKQSSLFILIATVILIGGGLLINLRFRFISDYAMINTLLVVSLYLLNFSFKKPPPLPLNQQ